MAWGQVKHGYRLQQNVFDETRKLPEARMPFSGFSQFKSTIHVLQ